MAKKLGVERTKGTLSGDIRYAIDIDEAIASTRRSISMEEEGYKPSKRDKAFSLWTQFQIAVTNEQAGIEVIGKQLGIKDIEAKVQAVRAARTEANEMIGGACFAPSRGRSCSNLFQSANAKHTFRCALR